MLMAVQIWFPQTPVLNVAENVFRWKLQFHWDLCALEGHRARIVPVLAKQKYCYVKKKLVHLLFDFGVIPEVLSRQLTTIVNNRFQLLHSVFNSWQQLWYDDGWALLKTAVFWCHVEQEAIFEHIFYLKPEYLPRGTSGGASECSNRISSANFIIVFHSNYGSILLGFWDLTIRRTMDRSW